MQSEKHKGSIKKYDCKNCYLFILRLYNLANGNLSKFITFRLSNSTILLVQLAALRKFILSKYANSVFSV